MDGGANCENIFCYFTYKSLVWSMVVVRVGDLVRGADDRDFEIACEEARWFGIYRRAFS